MVGRAEVIELPNYPAYPAIATMDKDVPKRDSSSTEKASVSVSEKVLPKQQFFDFGGDSSLPPPPQLTAEEEKRLWRKIDYRLMPILTLMYLCSFLDRGELSHFIFPLACR